VCSSDLYDPDAESWTPLPTRCGPGQRSESALAWIDDGLVVWGGRPACETDGCTRDDYSDRAWLLPAAAALGDIADVEGCSCPAPVAAESAL
jgi:hypothetical protein